MVPYCSAANLPAVVEEKVWKASNDAIVGPLRGTDGYVITKVEGKRDGSVSFVQTTGNSQNRSLGAGLNLVYQNAPWKVAFTAAFIETKADDVETSRKFAAALRGERYR